MAADFNEPTQNEESVMEEFVARLRMSARVRDTSAATNKTTLKGKIPDHLWDFSNFWSRGSQILKLGGRALLLSRRRAWEVQSSAVSNPWRAISKAIFFCRLCSTETSFIERIRQDRQKRHERSGGGKFFLGLPVRAPVGRGYWRPSGIPWPAGCGNLPTLPAPPGLEASESNSCR